jgi:hypothetical protein
MHGSMRGGWRGGRTPNQSPTLLPSSRPLLCLSQVGLVVDRRRDMRPEQNGDHHRGADLSDRGGACGDIFDFPNLWVV